jgi:hypothetical protein
VVIIPPTQVVASESTTIPLYQVEGKAVLPKDGEVLSLVETRIVGSWAITEWANGLKTVSPVDNGGFIRDSRSLPVAGFR